ncbi:phage portal protein [Streptomyces sp. NPDC101393]|uniref:phage portal protein n=1 Tax=Streptomyces sp. NPDC101393 TaxID=3366141 RepID=UPI0038129C87
MATELEMIAAGLAGLATDQPRMDRVDNYIRGVHDDPYMPKSATDEYKLLAKRAIANWMPLLVKTPAQVLSVTGYRRDGGADTTPEWDVWQQNRMDSRQTAIHRAALTYGVAYVAVTTDAFGTHMKGLSPRRVYASYADPASDALPLWVLMMDHLPSADDVKDVASGTLYTQTNVYQVTVTGGGKKSVTTLVSSVPHNMKLLGQPVCPVVRFAPDIDLEGRVTGVIEPMIPIQDRINQTTFDRLIVQTFGSFKVRTVTGMAPDLQRDPETGDVILDANGRPTPIPVRADASRFMMTPNEDAKFGTLDETPLDGFLEAAKADVKQLAAVSQTPPHYLLGDMVNLSAEALAAAESALMRAVKEFQRPLGEAWELVLALVSESEGSVVDAGAQVLWDDFESRSFAQVVDALGKAAQMLSVPPRALWSRIPGVTDGDVADWADMAETDSSENRLATAMDKALSAPQTSEAGNSVPGVASA